MEFKSCHYGYICLLRLLSSFEDGYIGLYCTLAILLWNASCDLPWTKRKVSESFKKLWDMIYMLTYPLQGAQPPAQKDSQIPFQRPCSRMTAQKINKWKTSVAGRLYSCAAQNKTGEGASQGRVLSWHSVPFVPPYRAAESCQPQSSFEPQKKRDCKAYFCFLVEFFFFF